MTAVDERRAAPVHPVALPSDSSASPLVVGATADLAPVDLRGLNAAAQLMTRVDNKYLLPLAAFVPFVEQLDAHSGGRLGVLQIDGQRAFDYESVYFDTDDFTLFRHHLQRRRRRYKARTRSYLSTGLCMFEVKLKGTRGETVKERIEHPFDDRARLTDADTAFLDQLLRTRYGIRPLPLSAQLTTLYRRTTLVDLGAGERITCDTDLTCADPDRSVRADAHIVVETKSATGRGPADAVLRDLGLRPVSVSKYCMAVALLNPHLPASPWNRVLRQDYGWERAA